MAYITVQDEHVLPFIPKDKQQQMQEKAEAAHNLLHLKKGVGSEQTGWLYHPVTYDQTEFSRIKACATTIQENSDVLLVVGVGGSYLGARAAIELLTHTFQHDLPKHKHHGPKVFFVGHHLSTTYINDLFDILEGQRVSVNVISKSGTTTEPAIAFRLVKQWMEEEYGAHEAKKRIYVTTDKERGALNQLAKQEGYELFVVPDNIGGRYSVLTAVGLLPIAVSGISIDSMMQGAKQAMDELAYPNVSQNPCYQYATFRNLLYSEHKLIELLVSYEPQFHYFQEWWKQLFGESEGKDGKGIFPASATYSTDLHSFGQYVQDGERHLFQTILHVQEDTKPLYIKNDPHNLDGLNYLTDTSLGEINHKAFAGALQAHVDGGVPNIVINIPSINAFTFGYLVYFFEKACAISGYILGVNPFDQPGVEEYKKNMSKLLKHRNNPSRNTSEI